MAAGVAAASEAKEQIARRMSEHTRVFKPIRICVMRELNQKALDSIRARRLERGGRERERGHER
jgi:hypothetical protein